MELIKFVHKKEEDEIAIGGHPPFYTGTWFLLTAFFVQNRNGERIHVGIEMNGRVCEIAPSRIG